jgi:hypothetical protein
MNRVAGDKAMSAQDAQRQQQGQPTAAQQAQGAKPDFTACFGSSACLSVAVYICGHSFLLLPGTAHPHAMAQDVNYVPW